MTSLIKFRTNLYFDRKEVVRHFGPLKAKALSKIGAYTRTRARRSIRKPRRKSLGEMTPEERADFKRRQRIAKQEGRPAPKRPFVSSKPGTAPSDVTGVLKRGIEFAADLQHDSMVAGPAVADTAMPEAPSVLEYGGDTRLSYGPDFGQKVHVAPRPSTHPAFESALADLPELMQLL